MTFQPDEIQIYPPPNARKRSKKWRRQFVQVPWTWAERLRTAKRVSTYRLALVLLYEAWRLGGRSVVLSNVIANTEGLSPRSKWRALAELKQLGLIEVENRPHRSPGVMLLEIP